MPTSKAFAYLVQQRCSQLPGDVAHPPQLLIFQVSCCRACPGPRTTTRCCTRSSSCSTRWRRPSRPPRATPARRSSWSASASGRPPRSTRACSTPSTCSRRAAAPPPRSAALRLPQEASCLAHRLLDWPHNGAACLNVQQCHPVSVAPTAQPQLPCTFAAWQATRRCMHGWLQEARSIPASDACHVCWGNHQQEVSEVPKSLGPDALLRAKVKQKRFRDGYEEGLSTTHRATPAAAFVLSEAPVEMLGQYSRRASHAV